MRGAVKLQAAIRRRQSRGLFAFQEAAARNMPSPGKYQQDGTAPMMTPGKQSLAGQSAFKAPTTRTGERFAGVSSIYGTSTPGKATPGVGEYELKRELGQGGTSGGGSAAFLAKDDRFARHDSIYVAPAGEEWEMSAAAAAAANDAAPDVPKRDMATAAFAPAAFGGTVDRFGQGSIYEKTKTADTPGVGSYEVSDGPAATEPAAGTLAAKSDANHASKSDRFALPGGVYEHAAANVPGVGTYEGMCSGHVEPLQHRDASYASATDRFALPGAVYAPTAAPGVGTYDPSDELQAMRVLGAVKLQAAIRRRQSRGIFAEQEAAAREVPGPGQYDTPAAATTHTPTSAEVRTFLPLATPVLDIGDAEADAVALPPASKEEDAKDEEAAAAKEATPTPMAAEGDVSLAVEATPIAAEGDVSLAVRFSVDAEALASSPILKRSSKLGGSLALPVQLERVVSLDQWLADPDDDDDDAIALPDASLVDAAHRLSALSMSIEASNRESASGDGDWLFSQLERICADGTIAKDDYHDDESGWDLEGLRSDLALYTLQGTVDVD